MGWTHEDTLAEQARENPPAKTRGSWELAAPPPLPDLPTLPPWRNNSAFENRGRGRKGKR